MARAKTELQSTSAALDEKELQCLLSDNFDTFFGEKDTWMARFGKALLSRSCEGVAEKPAVPPFAARLLGDLPPKERECLLVQTLNDAQIETLPSLLKAKAKSLKEECE